MEFFPQEVLLNVFSKLPVKSLHNVKLVCRQWRNLARDPLLVNLPCSEINGDDQCLIVHSDYPLTNQLYAVHLYRHDEKLGMVKNIQSPLLSEFYVVGSCNGLLCFSDYKDRNVFYVYNPAVNCFAELPRSTQHADGWTAFGFGFGFNSSRNEYKLVKISKNLSARFRHRGFMPPSAVEILTLGTSTWRNLGQTPYSPIASSSQVLVHGRLHWANWPRRYRRGRMLVSFDLENEQFHEVPKPDSADLERQHYELLVLGGNLSAVFYSSTTKWNIWIMKEYGVKESWINEFNIGNHIPRGLERDIDRSFRASKFYSRRYRVQVLCRLRNGEILLSYRCRALVAYDPMSSTFREVQIQGMPNWFEAIVHANSVHWIENLAAV